MSKIQFRWTFFVASSELFYESNKLFDMNLARLNWRYHVIHDSYKEMSFLELVCVSWLFHLDVETCETSSDQKNFETMFDTMPIWTLNVQGHSWNCYRFLKSWSSPEDCFSFKLYYFSSSPFFLFYFLILVQKNMQISQNNFNPHFTIQNLAKFHSLLTNHVIFLNETSISFSLVEQFHLNVHVLRLFFFDLLFMHFVIFCLFTCVSDFKLPR